MIISHGPVAPLHHAPANLAPRGGYRCDGYHILPDFADGARRGFELPNTSKIGVSAELMAFNAIVDQKAAVPDALGREHGSAWFCWVRWMMEQCRCQRPTVERDRLDQSEYLLPWREPKLRDRQTRHARPDPGLTDIHQDFGKWCVGLFDDLRNGARQDVAHADPARTLRRQRDIPRPNPQTNVVSDCEVCHRHDDILTVVIEVGQSELIVVLSNARGQDDARFEAPRNRLQIDSLQGLCDRTIGYHASG
jgi:hypothetical protein